MTQFRQAVDTAQKDPDQKAFLDLLGANQQKTRDTIAQQLQSSPERFSRAKKLLYRNGLITSGKRNGKIRLKTAFEFNEFHNITTPLVGTDGVTDQSAA